MIRRLTLDRFKAFREASFEFSPLTIIAGQNSSGKSSIIQALNAIFQSVQGRTFPLDLVLNGDKAHLGGFKNVIHGHDARNSFGIGIDFLIDDTEFSFFAKFKRSEEEGHLFPRQISARSELFGRMAIDWNQRAQHFNLVLDPSNSLVDRQRKRFFSGFDRIINTSDYDKRQALFDALDIKESSQISHALEVLYREAANESRYGINFDVKTFAEFLSKASANPFFDAAKRMSAEAVQQLDARCAYIGPLRASPTRYFPLAGGSRDVDTSGEGTSRTLARWKDRKSSLISEVRRSLTQLELASDLSISVEHDEFLKVGIKPHGRTFIDSIADVGFGLSQVLPMIVADLNLPPAGTLLVNQPEIHLHPSSQALLANYFLERISKRQYIIETHSEYLINRVRLLVAKGAVPCDAVRIIYCSADGKGGSSVFDVRVENDGSLTGAPKDFFSTYAADAFGIAMAVVDDDGDEDAGE